MNKTNPILINNQFPITNQPKTTTKKGTKTGLSHKKRANKVSIFDDKEDKEESKEIKDMIEISKEKIRELKKKNKVNLIIIHYHVIIMYYEYCVQG